VLDEVLRRSQALGFLGPGPVGEHAERAHAFEAALPAAPDSFLDLGSGGGVPGLVLATRWPARGVLLDAQARRVRFLQEALEELEVAHRVRAVHGRAEDTGRDPAHRGRYEVVTARSFGPPGITAECGVAFLRTAGVLLVAEPPDVPARWPSDGLATLGLADEGTASGGGATVRRLRLVTDLAATIPRRGPAMRRRPAF